MAAFTVIDHTELTGDTASWTESSIPSSYDHLYLVMSTRTKTGYTTDTLNLQVGNGSIDTGTNYSDTRLYATGTSVSSSRSTGYVYLTNIHTAALNTTADTFGSATVWIPNYTNTTGFKAFLISVGKENASTGAGEWYAQVEAGLWSSTSAITDIKVYSTGGDLVQYSTFTLYGVTGA
jgi:hypothetical protein